MRRGKVDQILYRTFLLVFIALLLTSWFFWILILLGFIIYCLYIDRKEKFLHAKMLKRLESGFNPYMSGEQYEIYCKYILKTSGWLVKETKASGDQGVDLIASNEIFRKVCIQCKRYSKPVGNKAIQEVFTGKTFYDGSRAVVVSNAGFTKSARNLAQKTDVYLISDTDLENLQDFLYGNDPNNEIYRFGIALQRVLENPIGGIKKILISEPSSLFYQNPWEFITKYYQDNIKSELAKEPKVAFKELKIFFKKFIRKLRINHIKSKKRTFNEK